MENKELNNILDKINPLDLPPTEHNWTQIKIEISHLLDLKDAQNAQTQQMLDLGYQEMYKIWDLVEQRDQLKRSIFDASKDMILILDAQGQVIEYNSTAEAMLGMESTEILGQKITTVIFGGTLLDDLTNLFGGKDSEKMSDLLRLHQERTLINRENKELQVSVFASKIQAGATTVFPIYITDLTAEKEAARELEESRSQLMVTSKMSALGEMAGGVAHEINTPLAVIQMRADQLLECLAEEPLDKEMFASALKAIDDTIKRIGKIVNGLRSFARDGSNDMVEPYSVDKIVDDTFSLCRERFNNHGVGLSYIKKNDVIINCRPGEISQVLLNLLNNSYDAIQGETQMWVCVELLDHGDTIDLRISDSGKSIPPEIQAKMMQPFFTTKEIGKGTGLGLSISRGIIQAHHGKLFIDNEADHTTLVITLPK